MSDAQQTSEAQETQPRRWTAARVLASPLIALVWVYQRFISPLTPPSCRFNPSCSNYAMTALVRFGPIKGSWLAVRRISRCHPWNPGGNDPVPQRRPRPPDRGRTERTHAPA